MAVFACRLSSRDTRSARIRFVARDVGGVLRRRLRIAVRHVDRRRRRLPRIIVTACKIQFARGRRHDVIRSHSIHSKEASRWAPQDQSPIPLPPATRSTRAAARPAFIASRSSQDAGLGNIAALPYSIRVLLESLLRNCDGYEVTEDDVKALAGWQAASPAQVEIPFKPARVVLQDFTGVPCVVDLAAMRAAMQRLGGDPKKINPLVPVDLVIDHSVQVDYFNSADALELNIDMEFSRNRERYEFLRWGQKAFNNFRVVPPGTGIVHQVNLEYLAKVVFLGNDRVGPVAFPDSLVGTDSHTTMIDGLGVVGWGVGGIEAEGVMLGQPIYMLLPRSRRHGAHRQAVARARRRPTSCSP